ncbi:sugar phosphate isomerase/epimerase family protein [Candidatus Latescibacterota bacterium]
MSGKISRRRAIAAGTVSTGALFASSTAAVSDNLLPDVWGNDFLRQWSPPKNVKRDLTPGPSPIRLSCAGYGISLRKRQGQNDIVPLGEQVKSVRDNGYTAVESSSMNWLELPDSQIRELRAALKQHDVLFYTLHQWQNILDPDPERAERNIRGIITGIESAERIGVENVVMHTGGRNPHNVSGPHKDNWTQETWNMGVAVTKRILKDTSGSKVNLAFEAVNCNNNNTPQSHVRLREDVGDPRVKVCLDPTNMMHPGVYFRTTELLNQCFDLIGEDIMFCHAKDSTWEGMSAAVHEGAVLGEGTMDYAQFLARLSRMKYPRAMLIEHLPNDQYPQCRQHLLDVAEKIGVKIYS